VTSRVFRPLVLAWHFLTAIPFSPALHEAAPRDLARSMGWYPLIGLVLGGILAVVDRGLSLLLTPMLVDVMLIALLVALTGGLHQDGLADTLDGISGGHTAIERLRIMRDPHIGAIGATGLVLDVMLRISGLQAIPDELRPQALLCFPLFGRWGIVVGAWGSRYARAEGGLAAPFLAELTWRHVGMATLLTVPVAVWLLGGMTALVSSGATILIARGVTGGLGRLCGGITGDMLGAVNELVEIAVLLLLPLGWGS